MMAEGPVVSKAGLWQGDRVGMAGREVKGGEMRPQSDGG